MRKAILDDFDTTDVVIMSAAVSDYRPSEYSSVKIKKVEQKMTISLSRNVDILSDLGDRKGPDQILVGFAAETENLIENATIKLRQKNCDFVVANPVGTSANGAGIDSDENQGVLLAATGQQTILPRSKKIDMARKIFDELLRQRPV